MRHIPSSIDSNRLESKLPSRILALDLARGFTVLFIPIIHSVMMYGNSSTYSSGFVRFLSFIAEWPGAQVFMIIMGISFALSRVKTFKATLKRSVVLLVLGNLLNFFKFIVPLLFGGLPAAFMLDMNATEWQPFFFVGDILQFAGIALFILWLIQKAPDRTLTALLIGMFVVFVTPVPWGSNFYGLDLFFGSPPRVFFPLFPWLAYPLIGFVIGESIKEYGLKCFGVVFFLGYGLMLSSFCATKSLAIAPDNNFYVSGPWTTLMHLGFASSWISVWYFITRISTANLKLILANVFYTAKKKRQIKFKYETPKWIKNFVFQFLQFLSRRITLIYFIQWPLVFWLLPVFGYHQLDVWESATIGIDITLVTLILTYIISTKRRQPG